MTNAFLPSSTHYYNETEYKITLSYANDHKYDFILFHPQRDKNVHALIETTKDVRILSIEYDLIQDRFLPCENDTVHVFPNRTIAMRYLEKFRKGFE